MTRSPVSLLPTLLLFGLVAQGIAQADQQTPFPDAGILPKETTGAAGFLEEHPAADGRGVIVAIFDSGVDPGAAGLQRTPDGRKKVIDLIDATGSGDVDTSTLTDLEEDRVTGLSGRTLHFPADWPRPDDGKLRLGLEPLDELFPRALTSRLNEEREKQWLATHRRQVAEARRRLEDASDDAEKREWDARLELLESLAKDRQDPGPVCDCVLFRSQDQWWGAIDTDEDGDLQDETLLRPYGVDQEFASFSDASQLSFAIQVYEEGDVLSIVTQANPHGTHVAGIVGAYYPEHPEWNGLAPGVQIISVKIGDSRLNAMETGTGILRGLRAAIDGNADLINMSYGEPTRLPDEGRLIEQIAETVHEHGVVFVASAGNAGPALSTAGAPGATSSAVIGVGAVVTPEMARAGYALRETIPPLAYTWTSRGPTKDGALGVSISAPGGAYSPVPTWTLQVHQHANGTSMSAPNASGNLALLLSALKQEGIPYSPWSIRRAVENTAEPISGTDLFAQGQGMLRIDRAYTHCKEASDPMIHFDVELPDRQGARGLYLRERHETASPMTMRVVVRPGFPRSSPNGDKARWRRKLGLRSTADWVETPDHLVLANAPVAFDITVSPAACANPSPVYAEVQGFDLESENGQILFRVPITLIVPREPVNPALEWGTTVTLEPGQVERRFFAVPSGARWAEIEVEATGLTRPSQLVLHANQVVSQRRHDEISRQLRLTLTDGQIERHFVPLVEDRTVELALASYWSNQESGQISCRIRFHGFSATPDRLALSSAEPIGRLDLRATSPHLDLTLKGGLSTLQRAVSPQKAEIRPLSPERDTSPDGTPVSEIVLTYGLDIDEATTVTPRLPTLDRRLYESDFQSMLWMIFDENKQRLTVDDGWDPSGVKLAKGSYTIRYHLRHADQKSLRDAAKQPLVLEMRLTKPLPLELYTDRRRALRGEQATSHFNPGAGRELVLHVRGPLPDALPALLRPGDILLGELAMEEPALTAVPVSYVVTAGLEAKDVERTRGEPELEDAIFSLHLARLRSLLEKESFEAFDEQMATLLEAFPEKPELRHLHLERHDTPEARKQDLEKILALCQAVLDRIDSAALAAYRGRRHAHRDSEEAATEKKEMDERFKLLTDTLYRKARAIAYFEGMREEEGNPVAEPAFEEAFNALREWVDTTEPDYVLAHIRWHRFRGEFGQALALLEEHIEESPPRRLLFDKRIKLLRQLGWDYLANEEEVWNLRRFPRGYPRF